MSLPGTADLAELEQLAGDLLRNLDASGRRTALRAVARRVQRARIASQRNPDDTPFAPQKTKTV